MIEKHASASDTSRSRSRSRVVVTGLGLMNPLGATLEEYWHALLQGRSGVQTIDLFDCSKLPVRFAGQISNFNAKQYLEKKERKNLRVMARSIQMAVAGAQLALDDSGLDKSQIDPARFGVEFGAGLMASELNELALAAEVTANCQPGIVDLVKWGQEGMGRIPPLWMLKYLPNMLACQVSILQNAQGPNNSITEGDVGGLLAIGEVTRILQRGQADYFLVGGADSKVNPLGMIRKCLFGELARNNDAPAKACRPFDLHRQGAVVGEGSGVLAVEELTHAKKRGARIYAEVTGFGAAFDAKKDGSGIARAIRQAMTEAGLRPHDIDHINAFGLGTKQTDIWEANGLQLALGDHVQLIPVFAAKSYYGNLGAGSAPTELIASLLALHHGERPKTRNYETPDPDCRLAVTRERQKVTKPYVLKVSFTEMGQCAALVCRTWDE